MDIVAFPRSHTQLTMNDPVHPSTMWRRRKNVSPPRRQFTISMPWPPKASDGKRQTFLPEIQGNARLSEKKIQSMSFLTKQQSSVHAPLIKRQNSLKSGINPYSIRSDSAQPNDVTDFSRTFQTLNDNKNLNTPTDRLGFKPIQRNADIKCEPRADYPIHSFIPEERRGPLNQSTSKHFRIIRVLYNTMASLKLDNRQELASNDHARHHNKRQQQWIRSEQVKNWRRSSVNKASKKIGYTSGSSSGQKSDVISGNSDDTIHTTSSQGENNHIFENPMDAEMKESFHKCLKWMENLPDKFSGMHIFTPSVSD